MKNLITIILIFLFGSCGSKQKIMQEATANIEHIEANSTSTINKVDSTTTSANTDAQDSSLQLVIEETEFSKKDSLGASSTWKIRKILLKSSTQEQHSARTTSKKTTEAQQDTTSYYNDIASSSYNHTKNEVKPTIKTKIYVILSVLIFFSCLCVAYWRKNKNKFGAKEN